MEKEIKAYNGTSLLILFQLQQNDKKIIKMVSDKLKKQVKEFYEEIGAPYNEEDVYYNEDLYRKVEDLESNCASLRDSLDEEGFGY